MGDLAPPSPLYSMPAEWEPHDATWICWPHNPDDWPDKMDEVQVAYLEMVRHLLPSEDVCILTSNDHVYQRASAMLRDAGLDSNRIHFIQQPTDSSWTRDYGPMFVRQIESGQLAINQFQFNAWARYPEYANDNRVSHAMADFLDLPSVHPTYHNTPVVLEGGAIDVNGSGVVLTTEQCLLDLSEQVRNPGLTQTDMEAILSTYLGVSQVIWLGCGIVGDDTHGHVDDLCRFVSTDTVVLVGEQDEQDANYEALRDNRERLESIRLPNGSPLNVVHLPMPSPVSFRGLRLPASYANFYIANHAVLVPTYKDAQDTVALGILSDLFPGRDVVGIDAIDLVWGQGSIHCLTQQQPCTTTLDSPVNGRMTATAES